MTKKEKEYLLERKNYFVKRIAESLNDDIYLQVRTDIDEVRHKLIPVESGESNWYEAFITWSDKTLNLYNFYESKSYYARQKTHPFTVRAHPDLTCTWDLMTDDLCDGIINYAKNFTGRLKHRIDLWKVRSFRKAKKNET